MNNKDFPVKVAFVIVPRLKNPSLLLKKTSGIPLLLRTFLALKQIAVNHIHLLIPPDVKLPDSALKLLSDHRLQETKIEVHQQESIQLKSTFWLLPANLIWDSRMISYFFKANQPADILTSPEADIIPMVKINKTMPSTEIMNQLIQAGCIRTEDIKKYHLQVNETFQSYSIQIKQPSDINLADHLLFISAFKESDGLVSRHFNRYISHFVARLFFNTNVTPNMISAFVFLLGLIAIYFASKGDYWSVFLGAFILNLNSIADGIDGEIARIKFMTTPFGAWLDRIMDKLIVIGFFAAFTMGHWQVHHSQLILILGLITVFGYSIGLFILYFYGYYKNNRMTGTLIKPTRMEKKLQNILTAIIYGSSDKSPRQHKKTTRSWLAQVLKNDFLSVVYLFLAILGSLHLIFFLWAPMVILLFITGIFTFTFLIRIIWLKRIK